MAMTHSQESRGRIDGGVTGPGEESPAALAVDGEVLRTGGSLDALAALFARLNGPLLHAAIAQAQKSFGNTVVRKALATNDGSRAGATADGHEPTPAVSHSHVDPHAHTPKSQSHVTPGLHPPESQSHMTPGSHPTKSQSHVTPGTKHEPAPEFPPGTVTKNFGPKTFRFGDDPLLEFSTAATLTGGSGSSVDLHSNSFQVGNDKFHLDVVSNDGIEPLRISGAHASSAESSPAGMTTELLIRDGYLGAQVSRDWTVQGTTDGVPWKLTLNATIFIGYFEAGGGFNPLKEAAKVAAAAQHAISKINNPVGKFVAEAALAYVVVSVGTAVVAAAG